MSEQEWLASNDPQAMLDHIKSPTGSWRKLRLTPCACCRALIDYLDAAQQEALQAAERFADGEIEQEAFALVYEEFYGRWHEFFDEMDAGNQQPGQAVVSAGLIAFTCCMPDNQSDEWDGAADAILTANYVRPGTPMIGSDLVRDIFGNPFRPVSFDPAWRTSTVVVLAKQMYDSRDFSAMPILGDALQDAACDHADILDHCRSAGPHVRGCWVVDLVLGRE
jgi:hypothetical protein